MRKKNIKSIAKVTVDGVGAVVEAAAVAVNPAGGVIVVIIQSIVDEVIDNHKERNNGQVFKLNKAILEKKKSEIFGIDDIPEEQIDLYFDQICKELGNWRFDVTENIRHYHYLDKCAQDIAERINPSEERLVLYTRRTLGIIVDECRKTRVYFDALESVMREIYDQFYQRNKSSEKNLLKLEECLYRYKGCIDDVIRKYDSNPHRPKNCSISFVQDELIFNEYERFIANDCFGGQKKEFDRLFSDLIKNDRKNTHFYQSKKSDIGRLLNSSSQKYADISKRTAKVQQELLKKNPGKAGEINRVFAKMNGLDLNNCFLISGYYGAGKTKLAYELAKNNLEVIHVFLSSNENLENQLKDSLNEIFGETETAKTLLNKYRDLQFVFVVDDLQRGFLSGNDIYEIFGFIEEYSQRNVKWLLLIQTDFVNWFQDIIKEYEENNAKIINAWDWSGELSAFVLYGWLKIDQRYKHIKAMDQMLLESTDVLPGWIEEVRLRNYFTPLFIRIVLSFKDHDELYLKPDISYPKFCKYYYGILARHNDYVKMSVDGISEICRKKLVNEIIVPNDFNETKRIDTCKTKNIEIKDIEALVNNGLLEAQKREERGEHGSITHKYCGTPDIIWFYRIASVEVDKAADPAQKVNRIYNQNIEQDDKRLVEKSSFIFSVCSMMVLLMEEMIAGEKDKEGCIKCIKEILMSRHSQAANDILKKSVSSIRNSIVDWLVTNDKGEETSLQISSLLRICEDGNVEFSVLKHLIEFVSEIKNTLTADEVSLFFNILYSNMEYYSYQECIEILQCLKGIDELKIVDNRKAGISFASIIYQKYDNHKNLVNESKNMFLEHGSRHYATFPKTIVDYYIEYIFDYYIAENGFEGFKYLIKKHYDTSQRLSDGKQNINKAIVMAGAYFFRHINLDFYIKWDPEDYSKKYKDMVKSYAAAEAIWKKRLAMYLIIHVGIKDNKYQINSSHDLLPVFRNLYKSKEMQPFLENSAHTFYKSNF